jgi:triphosphoribosyl-dephospho-CoA synthase
MISTGLCAELACIWEVTARKPGNVHRNADFDDESYLDFLVSAAAVAPVLAEASLKRVGATVLEAVRARRQVTHSNTNLGILLLLAPMAAVPREQDLRSGLARILKGLDVEDARLAYQAIRLAAPGGLGSVGEQDVAAEPTQTLREVMALAAERDLIALQYTNDFREVFETGLPVLTRLLETQGSLESAIVGCHLHLMAFHPDSLIARKRGRQEAEEASRRANVVLDSGGPGSQKGEDAFLDLDRWLREDGHQRNPGTTADLVTACLFAALRNGTITLPPRIPWDSRHHE